LFVVGKSIESNSFNFFETTVRFVFQLYLWSEALTVQLVPAGNASFTQENKGLCQQGNPCLHESRKRFTSGASIRQTPKEGYEKIQVLCLCHFSTVYLY